VKIPEVVKVNNYPKSKIHHLLNYVGRKKEIPVKSLFFFDITVEFIYETQNNYYVQIVYYATRFINGTLDTRFMLGTSEA
jgi:hypothetical protein